MVKKTVIAITCIFLLAVISVAAYKRVGMTDYGAVYVYNYPDTYASHYYPYYERSPYVDYPYFGPEVYFEERAYYPAPEIVYPANPFGNYRQSYLNPLSAHYMYRYGFPQLNYPVYTVQGAVGDLCGTVNGVSAGCAYGLVCDYTKVESSNLGRCSMQAGY